MSTRITDLTHEEGFAFLMQPQQYCTTELPEYFDFQPVLNYCAKVCKDIVLPEIDNNLNGINLDIMTNKDGRYGVRPITISNPFLYTFLAQTICEQESWNSILKCFEIFNVEHIKSCSIPIIPAKDVKESFHKSTTILNWWSAMEQTPIELSLKYRYMFMSDITNCFGQIIPKSIDWALSRKGTDFETEENHKLATRIISIIEKLQGNKNIGIPQGSTLYSFIAEIILGYSDLLLEKAVKDAGITAEYKVLRYVDDYRIFCNDRDALEKISYLLQGVLETLNFRMNVSKTRISDCIVADAVKPDKAFYNFNTPIINKKGVDFDGFQKHLYFIFEFGRKFPNSSQIKVQLSDFSKRLCKYLTPRASKTSRIIATIDLESDKVETCNEPVVFTPKLYERILPMIAILVQIASDNVQSAHYALRIISLLLDTEKDETVKTDIISMVYNKLRNSPNSAYMQLWLQTLTHATGIKELNDYDVPLCDIVKTPLAVLWNNSWLDIKIASGLPSYSVCNRDKLNATGQIITFREQREYLESVETKEY